MKLCRSASMVTIAALTGVTAGASGGDSTETLSLSMEIRDYGDLSQASTIVIDIIGDATFGTHIVGGEFGFTSGMHGDISDIRWVRSSWVRYLGGGEYDGNGEFSTTIYGQAVYVSDIYNLVPGEGSELGGVIGSFEIDFDAGLHSDISFDFLTTSRYALGVADVDFVNRTTVSLNSNESNLVLNGTSISVPAPSAMALLGFGGLAATRRRR